MMSVLRWLRSHSAVIIIAIVIIGVALFLIWPILFGPPMVTGPRSSISVSVPLRSAGTTTTATASSTASVAAPAPVRLLVVAGTSTVMNDEIAAVPSGENTFVLLKDQAAKDGVSFSSKSYPGLGDMVTAIGSFKNGAGGKYWQYTVNGTYMQVGADGYVPKPGDNIVWEFTGSQEGDQ